MAVLKSGKAVHEVKASDGMTCITEEMEIGSTFKDLPPERKC
ncbi:hypothetical protein WN943_010929 [Citrus x changshan-huyou]